MVAARIMHTLTNMLVQKLRCTFILFEFLLTVMQFVDCRTARAQMRRMGRQDFVHFFEQFLNQVVVELRTKKGTDYILGIKLRNLMQKSYVVPGKT